MSAYDIQKLVEYRNISKWVKISTPSIYKKVIQLEEKGLITSRTEKEGKMPPIFLPWVWRFYINSFCWCRQLKNGLQH